MILILMILMLFDNEDLIRYIRICSYFIYLDSDMIDPNLHRKIQTFRNSVRSSMLPCSLGLTGRDPQGETTMKSLCKFLFFNLTKLVNTYLLSL